MIEFSEQSLEFLPIPSNIVHLNKCLFETTKLNTIKVIRCEEEKVRIFDDKLIIGKTDIKSDIFDVLLFGQRNIKEVSIPSFIKKIGSNAFTFSEDAHLESIENDAFSDSSIESIMIPKSVTNIGEFAFMNCLNIK